MPKEARDKYIFIACISMVGIFFAWTLRCNFYFSESYDVLALNHIDDINFHVNLLSLREHFRAGEWGAIFANTAFAYGNIYWTPLFLLTLPIAKWGPVWLNIVTPREVSAVFYGLCLLAFCLICRARKYSRADASMGLVLLASCNGIFFATTCFHNHTIISALVLWSLYFLVIPPTRNRRVMACFLFGMVLGLKISALFVLPVFLLFLNKDIELKRKKIFSWAALKTNLFALTVIGVTAVISFSPTAIPLLFGNRRFIDESLSPLQYILFVAPHLSPPREVHLFKDLWENVFSIYYHQFLFAVGLLMAGWLVWKNKKKSLDQLVIPLSALISMAMILILANTTVRDAYFLRFYVLPFIFIFGFIFLEFANQFKNRSLLSLIVLIYLFLNYQNSKDYFLMQKTNYFSSETREQIDRLEVLRKTVHINPDDIIYIDTRVIFPFGPLENYKNVHYVYGHVFSAEKDATVYMFSKKMEIPKDILLAQAPYEKLYEDHDLQIVRRHP